MINYADDTALLSTLRTSAPTSQDILNDELNKISTWLRCNKLHANASKTKAMIFHPRQKRVQQPQLFLNETPIDFVDQFNYLGITLDKHLSMSAHIASVAAKISRVIGIMKKIKNFLPSFILKLIYDSLITCRIKYGLLVWGSSGDHIFKLQKKAIRVVNKSKFNAHTEPLFKKFNILKLKDDQKLQELNFYYKFVNNRLPQYFQTGYIVNNHDYHTYSTRMGQQLSIPQFRHEGFRRTLRYCIVNTVNSASPCIINKISTHSFRGYSNYCKTKFLSIYSNQCLIPNCYICAS